MHLICPPKCCITFVFHFSWVLQPPKRILKTMLMQNFLGANKVHYGRCARDVLVIFFMCPVTVPEVFAIVNSAQFNFLLVSDVALLHWYGHLLLIITFAIWVRVRVRVTGDAHFTRVLGMGMPQNARMPISLWQRWKNRVHLFFDYLKGRAVLKRTAKWKRELYIDQS